MSQIFTTVLSGHNHSKMFFLLPFLAMPIAGFELSTLGIWVKCSTTVLLGCSHLIIFFFITFLLLVLGARFEPSILGLRVECSTTSPQPINRILIFWQLTVLPLWYQGTIIQKCFSYCHFSQCQLRDLNCLPWEYESSVLDAAIQ